MIVRALGQSEALEDHAQDIVVNKLTLPGPEGDIIVRMIS